MLPIPKPLADEAKAFELCKQLVPGGTPVTLEVRAPKGMQPLDCIGNVERMIEPHGGEAVYGWSLMETLPDVMMEAEFHAVWRGQDGLPQDVTPKQFPAMESITVFLADPDLFYEGQQINNVRMPLRDEQLVRSFIRTAERKFEAWNRGDLANYHGDMRGRITPEMERIEQQQERFLKKIAERYYSKAK
jgi:hypothetical protein